MKDPFRLHISKYRFQMRATSRIHLSGYKGSTFHGGLGRAIHTISPTFNKLLFLAGNGTNNQPKPHVLLPPLDDKTEYIPGTSFALDLTLFGEAVSLYSVCHASLEYLGNRLGLGREKGTFKVEDVATDSFCFQPTWDEHQPPAHQTDIPKSITLHFITRLRLKNDNRLLRDTLPFPLLMSKILGRLNQLGHFYGQGNPVNQQQKNKLLNLAEEIETIQHDLQWRDWDRFSGRQKTWMKFGGLMGSVTYQGDLAPFLPYLEAGEWTHIGGKTSFGLGKYTLKGR